MEPMKNIPVYRHSAAYAVEHGELVQDVPGGRRCLSGCDRKSRCEAL